ncbi:MAG: acyltransferase [Oscillospiraceae bacterium]|nr:acyltransferase [Oscillospiraceae bacterium]
MRKSYLDNIRWGTQIVVVLYHVIFLYNSVGIMGGVRITDLDRQPWDIFLYIVHPWMMPILFIVSGICSRYYLERHTDKEFIKSRTTKLLVPSTIGLFAFQFIQGYVSMSLSGAFDSMPKMPGFIQYIIMAVSGQGVLWYMQELWILSLLLVLVRKIERDRLWEAGRKAGLPVLHVLTAVVWGTAQILNMPVIVVYRFGIYTALFFIGYFVFSHDEVTEVLKKYFVLFISLAAVSCTAFCIMYFGQNYADAPVYRSILFTVYAWTGCLAILGGCAKYADFETSFTKWMSAHSFGLYVFHYLFISGTALLLGRPRLLPAPFIYLISAVTGFAGAYLLAAVISRIPFFRWAVLGIKKEKKNVQG